jgi:hypothetical protein
MRTNSKYRAFGVGAIALAAAFGAYCSRAGGEDHSAASMIDMQGVFSPRTEQTQPPDRSQRESRLQAALARLEVEARKGVFAAQMRLARIYSRGKETPRNDAKAFYYYRQVADQNADIDIYHPAAKYVAEAFRALAGYYRSGVPVLNLAPDRAREGQLLQQGASYFQDPAAQFMLAKMYLNGDGVTRNTTIGVRWLVNASRRRYALAQAVLGDLLWDGKGVKSSPGEGLALLVLAKDNAAPEDAGWISALCDKAMAQANEVQTKVAQRVLAKFEKLYRLKAGGALSIARPGQPAPDPLKSQAEALGTQEALGAQEGLEAGALLGLFGNEDVPLPTAGSAGATPGEFDHLPVMVPLDGAGGGGSDASSHGMFTGFAPRAGGVAPASATAPKETEGHGFSR